MAQKVYGPASEKQRLVLTAKEDIVFVGGAAGSGKALAHGEKVLTPAGFVNIENIVVGDAVITPQNTIEYVKNVWPQGVVYLYKITFQDGREIKTCGEHLWKSHRAGNGGGRDSVKTTLQLKSICDTENKKGPSARKYKPIIPLASPVGLGESELPVPPYTLGAILGDGDINKWGHCRLTGMDSEIFSKVAEEGMNFWVVSHKPNNRAWSQGILGITKEIKSLGLENKKSWDKFIPEIYKTSSIEDRFAILQGLFDTDGYVDINGNVSFDVVSEQLSNDVADILFSLGYSATKTSKAGRYKKDGETVECHKVFKLYVRGQDCSKLFTLKRKVDRCRIKKVGLRIDSIEPAGRGEATCIAITGNEKLFVTTNHIVTHNSMQLLMKNLDAAQNPGHRIVICRNSRPDLTQSGGLVSESESLYYDFKAGFNKTNLTWTFPTGSTIQFLAVPDEMTLKKRQGLQASRICIDEVCETWTQEMVLFLLTRLRKREDCPVREQLIMTGNPNPNSFLKEWIKYSLDPLTEIPKKGTENIVRWLVIIDGNIHWGDDPKELYKREGKKRGKVYAPEMSQQEIEDICKVDPTRLFEPKSFRFIPATIYDNPYLLPPKNSTYLASLLSQSPKNQMKFLAGSWKNIDLGQNYFSREWVKLVDLCDVPENLILARAWDLAATPEPEHGMSGDPDYTAGVLIGRSNLGDYYVLDVERFRKSTSQVIERIIEVGLKDGPDICTTVITKDPGGAAAHFHSFLAKALIEAGLSIKSLISSGWTKKLGRFKPFSAMSEQGNIYVLRADWNEAWFTELEAFTGGDRKIHDD